MKTLPKLKKGDKVAILSPSFAAPGKWPHVYRLGLVRLKHLFGLDPVEFPTTCKLGATTEERAQDLVAAFQDDSIKAVIASIGGDDQVTYIKNLPVDPFIQNPKPFFGFSDNTHFCNFLFLHGIPSYYGGSLFTQYAMQGEMHSYTVKYIEQALFNNEEVELVASETYNDQGLNWDDESLLTKKRMEWENNGHVWDKPKNVEGVLWGGCIESIDEMLRHNIQIPTLDQFKNIVLMLESSEEMPSAEYVFRVIRALGERGILKHIQAVLVGRAKASKSDKPRSMTEKEAYVCEQQETVLRAVRMYNETSPIIQNMNFGHTDPQIPMPYGNQVRIEKNNKVFAKF